MQPTRTTRSKICGISTIDETMLVIRFRGSVPDLISAMLSNPGTISEELISQIATAFPPTVSSSLLLNLRNAGAIFSQQRESSSNTVQISALTNLVVYVQMRR